MMIDPGHVMVTANGVTLHVAQAGPEDGPAVILLHGFPESWLCWRRQIGPLAEAGYRVMAPDQRGYGTSAKPPHVVDYSLEILAADVIGLIDSAGREKAALVGHDWGGIVAWWVAMRYPDRVQRLAVLNAPHPVAFRRYLIRHPSQLLKSWYTFFFQLPFLPEAHFRRANWHALTRALRTTSRPGAFTEEDLDLYRQAWSEPGAITAMIHWYRAAMRHRPPEPADPKLRVPTLLIWGAQDAFIARGVAEASLALCDDGRLEWFEEATHWVHHEEPEPVNRRLLDFLGVPGAW
jgi:pimeloyl-ACP methyl ester carboxylesterase